MDKAYNHKDYEDKIYKLWEKSGAFTPKVDKIKKPFTIIMPPPNANDPLHIGHAMFVTVEDILVRYHRMKGDVTLWLPGTDHAGIETQFVFEKKLAKEGKSRFDLDRETLYKMIWDYVQENSGVAITQMKRIGASADWSRFKFTLDADIIDFVLDTFIKLYNNKMVYRGERLVNYCTKCGTGYSELEVEYVERKDPLYYIKYGPFVLATVRPETKFGDTAVAVNPKDKRYKSWVGKEIEVEGLTGKFKLKVIADTAVDPEFGTGVVKVTPGHDPTDWEIGQRHNLEIKRVVGFDGKLTEIAGLYQGLKVVDARKKVSEDMQKKGLIEKIDENYSHRVGTCYRCHSVIEPLPLPQFFVKTKPLAEKVLKALDKKETKILGPGWDKILRNWLKNIKDWNISRQIVWGIKIPVWYDINQNPDMEVRFLDKNKKFVKGKVGELLKTYAFTEIEKGLQSIHATKEAHFKVSKTKPVGDYLPETDSFDTWFSSGQWPVITLKTNRPGDFEYFYPTQVMETGYDILTRWVMRMLLLSIYLTNKSPFENVYLHGLIRDQQGRKMSKSIGNVINPLDVADKYGTDALRMALVMSTTPGRDNNVGEEKIKGMRNFSNKIWNAARYVLDMQDGNKDGKKDSEVLSNLKTNIETVTKRLNQLKIGQAAEWIYNWFWHTYCDRYIELSKKGLVSKHAMLVALETNLKLLHPFVPFVTEAIWGELKTLRENPNELLITSPWPETS